MLKKPSPLKHKEGRHMMLTEDAHQEEHANDAGVLAEESTIEEQIKPTIGTEEDLTEFSKKFEVEKTEKVQEANKWMEDNNRKVSDYNYTDGVFTRKDGSRVYVEDEDYDALMLSAIKDPTLFELVKKNDSHQANKEQVDNANERINSFITDNRHNSNLLKNPLIIDPNTAVASTTGVNAINLGERVVLDEQKSPTTLRNTDAKEKGEKDFNELWAQAKINLTKTRGGSMFDISDDDPELETVFRQLALTSEAQGIYNTNIQDAAIKASKEEKGKYLQKKDEKKDIDIKGLEAALVKTEAEKAGVKTYIDKKTGEVVSVKSEEYKVAEQNLKNNHDALTAFSSEDSEISKRIKTLNKENEKILSKKYNTQEEVDTANELIQKNYDELRGYQNQYNKAYNVYSQSFEAYHSQNAKALKLNETAEGLKDFKKEYDKDHGIFSKAEKNLTAAGLGMTAAIENSAYKTILTGWGNWELNPEWKEGRDKFQKDLRKAIPYIQDQIGETASYEGAFDSWYNLGDYVTQTSAQAAPLITAMVLTRNPKVAMGMMYAYGAGDKYYEMDEEITKWKKLNPELADKKYGEYSTMAYHGIPFLSGTATAVSERFTFGRVQALKSAFRNKGPLYKGALNSMKNQFKPVALVKGGKDVIGEGGTEWIDGVAQASISKYLQNDESVGSVLEGTDHDFMNGVTVSAMLFRMPTIGVNVLKGYQSGRSQKEIDDNTRRQLEISDILSSGKVGKETRAQLHKELGELTVKNHDILRRDVGNLNHFSRKEKETLTNIEVEKSKLRVALKDLQLNNSLNNETKKAEVEKLKNKHRELDGTKEKLINIYNKAQQTKKEEEVNTDNVKKQANKIFGDNIEIVAATSPENSAELMELSLRERKVAILEQYTRQNKPLTKEAQAEINQINDDLAKIQDINKKPGQQSLAGGALTSYGYITPKDQGGRQKIILNNKAALKDGFVTTAQHEFLHAVMNETLKNDPKVQIAMGEALSDYMAQVTTESLAGSELAERMKGYTFDEGVFNEEKMNLLSEAMVRENLPFKKETFEKVKDFKRRFYQNYLGKEIEFNTGKDVYNFLKDYNHSIKTGKFSNAITNMAREGASGTLVQDAKSRGEQVKMSKEASENVQRIYKDQGIAGAFDIIDQFKPITSKLVERRREAPNFDRQLLMDEIETGKRGMYDLIQDYNPESGVPLAAYINKYLPSRAIEASQRVLGEEFTEDISERVDIAIEEKAAPEVKTKPRKKKVVLADRFGISDKVNNAIRKIVPNLDIDNLNFKNLKNKIPNVTGKLFGIAPKKIENLANLTKKELQSAQMFIGKNADLLINMLPEGATVSGTATGVPNTLLKAFYTKTDRAKMAKTGTKAGLAIQQKNNIKKTDFLETFGIIDGKPVRTDRNTSARVLALANLTGKMITNQAVRTELAKIKANEKAINKIAEGKSIIMFSQGIRNFNINGTIDDVLTAHKDKVGKTTFRFTKESDVDLYVEALMDHVLPTMPRDFWFGKQEGVADTGSEFTDSSRMMNVPVKTVNGIDVNKKARKDLYEYYVSKINHLNLLPDSAFGPDVDGVNDYQRTEYKTLFENKKGLQKDLIKEVNKKSGKIHEAMWRRMYKSIQDNPSHAAAISNFFKAVGNRSNHWHRYGAERVGYSTKPKGDKKKTYEYEHAMPATASYMYLIDAALKGYNFESVYKPVMDNFKLIALDAAENKKLSAANLGTSMPEGWNTIDNKWWERYFNDKVNIDPESIITLDGKTLKEEFNIIQFKPDLKDNIKFSKAINKSRLQKESKGITVLDFDDTLATTKSLVRYTAPDGTKGTLNAEQYASQYQDLLEQGYKFDFTEFDKVVKGKLAPLFNKAMKLQGKFGPENMFVLTARPPAAQQAIRDFLKANGLNIPVKNITGLGNSTSEAKALWMADKVGEGYNDFYFADDALQNVQAVKNMLDQFDVKSKIQQARVKFSKNMNTEFNDILENVTGIESKKRFAAIKARKRGASKGKFRFFIPPSHEDFVGLLYNFMGKGRQGDQHRNFFEQALIKPLNRANREYDTARQSIATDYKALNKQFPDVKKKLTKKTPDGDFTNQDAIRIYLWDKHGHTIPGLSEIDQTSLVELVKSDPKMQAYAETLNIISKQDTYINPTNGWNSGDIRVDLDDATGRVGREQFFTEFNENSEVIFSEENLNKIEAGYGKGVREALEDMLFRVKTGRNRPSGQNETVNRFMNYLNGSVGSVMFFNMRSALLQQMSLVNYINFADNNVFAAAKAFANQPQYWKDFAFIFNSDMLKQRRGGIQTDVNGAELAASIRNSKNPSRVLISKLLELGFLPTQIGDNIAIATGGSTFYRNRINKYIKDGLNKKEAETKAFDDFQAITQSTQQSARPDMVSQQQASVLGKVILNFQNVTSQFNRLGKKAFQDIYNRRITQPNTTQMQSDISNASRIAYYFAVQNAIFYTLQTALFTMMFGDDEEKENVLFLKKKERLINGSIDSVLRGSGVIGAVISTLKNTAIAFARQRDVRYNPDESAVLMEALNVSPVVGIKARKITNAEKTLNYNKSVIKEMETFDIDNPQWSAVTNYIEAGTNLPLNRLYNKTQNVRQALNNDNANWERTLMFLGWSQYNLGIKSEKIEEVKETVKIKKKEASKEKAKIKKEEKKKQIEEENKAKIEENKKKSEKDGICSAISKGGNRCKSKAINGGMCTVHEKAVQRADGKKAQCKKIKKGGKKCKMQTSNKSGYCYYHD